MLPDKISKPTLIIDQKKTERNIAGMVQKVSNAGALLRPHFKTHQSATIGSWFRNFGVEKCTVSSVEMAAYFAANGWDDITIAFPFNPRESDQINELAKSNTINILLESIESAELAKESLSEKISFFIKIDLGYHRAGIDPANQKLIKSIMDTLSSSGNLTFAGFLGHAGHAYTGDHNRIREIFSYSKDVLNGLKSSFGGIVSYGDTPSCSIVDDFTGVDEIRAGNFTFYDLMQLHYGDCNIADIACCLAAPVVARYPQRNEIGVYGGGVHLSKDFLNEETGKTYGKAVQLQEDGWSHEIIGNVSRISQEHGIIRPTKGNFDAFQIGSLVGILPVHSCLAADLQGSYLSSRGEYIEKRNKN